MDVTLLFELVAWSGNTEKRLPTISFMMFSVFVLSILLQITLILCHDSEAAKCLSNSVAIDCCTLQSLGQQSISFRYRSSRRATFQCVINGMNTS